MANLDSNSARMRSLVVMTGEICANKGSIGSKGDSDRMSKAMLTMGSNTITRNTTTIRDRIIILMHWNLLNKKIDLLNRR